MSGTGTQSYDAMLGWQALISWCSVFKIWYVQMLRALANGIVPRVNQVNKLLGPSTWNACPGDTPPTGRLAAGSSPHISFPRMLPWVSSPARQPASQPICPSGDRWLRGCDPCKGSSDLPTSVATLRWISPRLRHEWLFPGGINFLSQKYACQAMRAPRAPYLCRSALLYFISFRPSRLSDAQKTCPS